MLIVIKGFTKFLFRCHRAAVRLRHNGESKLPLQLQVLTRARHFDQRPTAGRLSKTAYGSKQRVLLASVHQTKAYVLNRFQRLGLASSKLSSLLPEAAKKAGNNSQPRGIFAGLTSSKKTPPHAADTTVKLQAQHLNLTSTTGNATAQTGPLQSNSTAVPISAGWSSIFKTQLSAAANSFQEHAQTAASSPPSVAQNATTASLASAARLNSVNSSQAFPWNQRMVDKKICDDSCDKAVRLCRFHS